MNRDAYILCIINIFTVTLIGFLVFGVLGNISLRANTNIDNVLEPGEY